MKMIKRLSAFCFFFVYLLSLQGQATGCITTTSFSVNVQVCDAIQEIEGLRDLTISPNPAQEQFELSFVVDSKISLHISFLDPLKRVLFEEEGLFSDITHKYIQVNELAAGLYFLVVRSDKGILSRKVIVQ